MRTFGRLLALLGLSLVVMASPREERFSSGRSRQIGNPAPVPKTVAGSTGLSPLATLSGGDFCGEPSPPTPITVLPFNDTGTTIGKVDNSTNSLPFACFGGEGSGPSRPGPDVFYSFTILGPGNSLTFSLTTTSNTYDPAIYVLSACGDLFTCQGGVDAGVNGDPESFIVSNLPAGTYYLGVDSAYVFPDNSADGAYALSVTGSFGNTPTPTATPTATPTGTTPTPTPTVTPTQTPTPLSTFRFYTVAPCRVADTRDPVGPFGAPPLQAGAIRNFTMTGRCNLPPNATAVSVNITVAGPTTPGYLTVFPAGSALPLASMLNYGTNQVRANNAIVPLGTGGAISIFCGQSSGTTDVIIDVNGYFISP
ncbi:MAG TPA: hypothetical protein VFW81_01695, partial [Thermoanaerobaculia bacterium]|nr:hypothetical protein [Thermoanaerobaculia bacterium]